MHPHAPSMHPLNMPLVAQTVNRGQSQSYFLGEIYRNDILRAKNVKNFDARGSMRKGWRRGKRESRGVEVGPGGWGRVDGDRVGGVKVNSGYTITRPLSLSPSATFLLTHPLLSPNPLPPSLPPTWTVTSFHQISPPQHPLRHLHTRLIWELMPAIVMSGCWTTIGHTRLGLNVCTPSWGSRGHT